MTAARIPRRLRDAAKPGADIAVRAPGRANLIGEHTDYNDGFVLPVALECATYVLGRRSDGVVRLRSLQEPDEAVVDLRSGSGPTEGWGRYVTAVVRALRDASVEVVGLEGVLDSDVPAGSGLSSSAALEVCVALAVAARPPDPVRLAHICRRAENHYVGVASGIMDQLASAAGRAGRALLIDCRDDSIEEVALPEGLTVLVVDSMVRRGLGDSGYNELREQCRAAARALGVDSLRDARPEMLERLEGADDVVARRARHVVTENERVLEAVEGLRADRRDLICALFAESHRSLAEDYEVSTPELDALVACAGAVPGVIGARLTGAGFGGCTVNLVERERAEAAAAAIAEGYARATGRKAHHWISMPADGARRL